MYCEWPSLQEEIQCDPSNKSVLHKFPATTGREVASSVVRAIAASLGPGGGAEDVVTLHTEKDVNWTMEVCQQGPRKCQVFVAKRKRRE